MSWIDSKPRISPVIVIAVVVMAPPVPTATASFIASLTQTLRQSAHRSDSRWVVGSYSELTEHEQRLVDRWMMRLYEHNRVPVPEGNEAIEKARKLMWDLAFSGNWDSNSPIPAPKKARERTADESTVLIGTLLRDAEVSRKRSANGDARPVAQHRRQDAEVYLKINIKWQLENIVFMLCDSKGANFGPHIDFEMREGYHLGLAKGLCTAN